MRDYLARTRMLIGEKNLHTLQESRVALVGVGGVGGHCAEALARGGVGSLYLIDGDSVDESNFNRQLAATKSALYALKVEAMKKRINEISDCAVYDIAAFLTDDNIDALLPENLSFIVDAIDTIASKLALIRYAHMRNIPIISSMGAGNRLDPTAFFITDIYKTEGCPLARAGRQGCRRDHIPALPVVMSRETPLQPQQKSGGAPGSMSFVPGAAGLALAGYVINTLCKYGN